MPQSKPAGIAWQDTIIGLGVVLLAVVIGWQTSIIPENAVYAKVGPKVFPWLSTGLLLAMGALLTAEGLRGGWEHEHSAATDWYSLGWLTAGLFANVALISYAGFIIAGTILFICTARAFGSRQALRDGVIALVLAVVAYVGFDRVLGYKIGTGLIEGLL